MSLTLTNPFRFSYPQCLESALCVSLKDPLDWHQVGEAMPTGFINVHNESADRNGIVYFAQTFDVLRAGDWILRLGHDGGAKMFVDGRCVFLDAKRINPAMWHRSQARTRLSKGRHEIVVALDTAHGKGEGIFFCFQTPLSGRKGKAPVFPTPEK